MPKKHSLRFWIAFITLSVVFLSSWFLYWNVKNQGIGGTISRVTSVLPISSEIKKEYQTFIILADYFLKKDGEEKKILVLFMNNMEIRPGGGFIGAFGVIKMKDGKVENIQTHDLSNFDARIPTGIEPPYPMKEINYVENWKFRDSNFSPDFKTNAQKAKEFYSLAGANANFDAVIGITSNVLSSILKITGPITLKDYPGTYDSGNAILALEYQVEKAFEEQGIERDERKSIMVDLAEEIENRIFDLSVKQYFALIKILIKDLSQKDIQFSFTNSNLQEAVSNVNWAGELDSQWNHDYLMTSDANLGSFKSDYYVKRSMDYYVDLTGEKPKVTLKINYKHSATKSDWMTRNYLTYLRVYVPQGSELISSKNFDDIKTGDEFGKKYFGSIVRVPIANSKTVEVTYNLPADYKNDYALKIQKQAGINDEQVNIEIKNKDGNTKKESLVLNSDLVIE